MMAICSLLAVLPIQSELRTVYHRDDLLVRTNRGSVSVLRKSKGKTVEVFQMGLENQYLAEVSRWVGPGTLPTGALALQIEYSSGSQIRLVLVAPVGKKRSWRKVLDTVSDGGYLYPFEVVDLRGSGVLDVITKHQIVNARPTKAYAFDKQKTTVDIWRWNEAAGEYTLFRTVPYENRLEKFP